jgi:hypothetical protein
MSKRAMKKAEVNAERPTHIYVSGPMRNRDGFNFPLFFAVEAELHRLFPEADICNPAREDVVRFGLHDMLIGDPTGLTAGRWLMDGAEFGEAELRDALGRDLAYITQHCDLIVMLPEWEGSKGATCERATALALGVEVVYAKVPEGQIADLSPSPEPDAQSPTETAQDAPGPVSASPAARSEVRVTSATGGQKGTKLAAFDQVSPEVEVLVAEHFGKGARKYDAHNFRKGYPWSLSYSALRRHLAAFWAGEEYDNCPEDGAGCVHRDGEAYEPGTCYNHTGSLHIVAVVWHAMVLTEFYLHRGEYDDRYVYQQG